jgi:hypothetical protein
MMRDWTTRRTLSPQRRELLEVAGMEEFVNRELAVWVILTQPDPRA